MKISVTVAKTFEDFLLSRKAKGLSEKTLATYKQHFSAISKHLFPDIPTDELSKEDLERMISHLKIFIGFFHTVHPLKPEIHFNKQVPAQLLRM